MSVARLALLALVLWSSPAAARGVREIRMQAPSPSPVSVGVVPARACLNRDNIRRVVFFHLNEIRNCYQQELIQRPTVAGRLVVRFTLDPKGQVRELRVQQSTLDAPRVVSCVGDAMLSWQFQATPGYDGVTIITYPFLMQPRQREEPATGIHVSDEDLAQLGIEKDPEPPAVDLLF